MPARVLASCGLSWLGGDSTRPSTPARASAISDSGVSGPVPSWDGLQITIRDLLAGWLSAQPGFDLTRVGAGARTASNVDMDPLPSGPLLGNSGRDQFGDVARSL
jgi:hypothetical protein